MHSTPAFQHSEEVGCGSSGLFQNTLLPMKTSLAACWYEQSASSVMTTIERIAASRKNP